MKELLHEDHVELSDGDTKILSIKACPLTETSEELINNGVACCINNGHRCDGFFKYWMHEAETHIQCVLLSETTDEVSPSPFKL